MRLIDLEPRWWSAHVGEHDGEADRHGLTFLCPHCKTQRLGAAFSHAPAHIFLPHTVGSPPIWQSTGDTFDSLTLTPSLDFSASGHWHGHIQSGVIVGGVQA